MARTVCAQSHPGLYVVTGVGYWNRDGVRRWSGEGVPVLIRLGQDLVPRNASSNAPAEMNAAARSAEMITSLFQLSIGPLSCEKR